MPTLSSEVAASVTNRFIIDELDYDISHKISRFESLSRLLNSNQHHVLRSVVDTHHKGEAGLCLLYDSSGSRKTYLWNTIIFKF